jgi:hypothetical protein
MRLTGMVNLAIHWVNGQLLTHKYHLRTMETSPDPLTLNYKTFPGPIPPPPQFSCDQKRSLPGFYKFSWGGLYIEMNLKETCFKIMFHQLADMIASDI